LAVFKEIENMKPMVTISTQFITFREIKVKDIDLIEDAMGLNTEFFDVIDLLRQINEVPERCLTTSLIKKIRKKV
jgi:hypothetical protein